MPKRKTTTIATPEPEVTAQMKVEMWPIDRPKRYEKNPRVIPEIAVQKVARSIHEFGFRVPIVCDEQDVMLAGHTRLLAAESLKLTEVPVHVAAGLTATQKRAFRISDNRVARESTWHEDLLGAELLDLQDLGEIDVSLTGFDEEEIRLLIDGPSSYSAEEEEQSGTGERQKVICPNCSHEFLPD